MVEALVDEILMIEKIPREEEAQKRRISPRRSPSA